MEYQTPNCAVVTLYEEGTIIRHPDVTNVQTSDSFVKLIKTDNSFILYPLCAILSVEFVYIPTEPVSKETKEV